MTGMGPEALLVRSRVDPRVELAEYALRDCSRPEVRAVEEMIRRELACLPVRRSAAQRLLGWGRKRLRRDDVPLAVAPAVWRERAEAPTKAGAPARALGEATLAAMPAVRAGVRPDRAGPLIAALPVYARE